MMKDEQGPMENLLDGLERQIDALSMDELKAELQAKGIDADAFLKRARAIINNSQQSKITVALSDFADAVSTMAVGCFHQLGEQSVKEIITKADNLKAALKATP